MKPFKNVYLTALTLLALSAGVWAQTSASTSPAQPITAADVQALKDALAAQQQLIERLTLRLDRQEGRQEVRQADAETAAPQVQPVSQQQPAELKNAVLVQQ